MRPAHPPRQTEGHGNGCWCPLGAAVIRQAQRLFGDPDYSTHAYIRVDAAGGAESRMYRPVQR